MTNHLFFFARPFGLLRPFCLPVVTIVVFLSWIELGSSQTVPCGPTCPAPVGLPLVPLRVPRPPQGPGPGEQWNCPPDIMGLAPTASFIDSLRTNDAAVEVVVGQGRLLVVKGDLVSKTQRAAIAVGDPTVLDFQIMPDPRMIRLTGKRAGITDLSIIAADGRSYAYEVHVVFDLEPLRAHLRQVFPDTRVRLAQLRNQVIVEGQARSIAQIKQILQVVETDLISAQAPFDLDGSQGPAPDSSIGGQVGGLVGPTGGIGIPTGGTGPQTGGIGVQAGGIGVQVATQTGGGGQGDSGVRPRIVNLLRVPGVHQIMLQVRMAELNRTAFREIGADILGVDPKTGNIIGTKIGGALVTATGSVVPSPPGLRGLQGSASAGVGPNTTAFGIFPSQDFEILIRHHRQKSRFCDEGIIDLADGS